MVKCQKCGVDLGPAEKVCPICGTPRPTETPEHGSSLELDVVTETIAFRSIRELAKVGAV